MPEKKKHVWKFKNLLEYESYVYGPEYSEPFVSATLTGDSGGLSFNDYCVGYNLKNIEQDLIDIPLTFKILSGGTIRFSSNGTIIDDRTIEYKKNDEEYVSITSNTEGVIINVSPGDVVKFRGNNESMGSFVSPNYSYTTFCGSTAVFDVYGNIMSLLDKDNFQNATSLTGTYNFAQLFRECNGLKSVKNMVMPAKALTLRCYQSMFYHCYNMQDCPELPATTLSNLCYSAMFNNCRSMAMVPELPAKNLAERCYEYMFSGCTSLTNGPELPATNLVTGCYQYMFINCNNLLASPDLIAQTLVQNCYRGMFSGCTKLNYIKCTATNISASAAIQNWVSGVQTKNGTFIKNSSTSWSRGVSGVPNNWTIENG